MKQKRMVQIFAILGIVAILATAIVPLLA